MDNEVLSVEMQVSKNGEPWLQVSSRSWQPGVNAPLRLHGEPLPQAAMDDLINLDPTGHESGSSETPIGDVRFRMVFRR